MDILYLLVPLSVVLAIAIGVAFWWAVRNDQFEDMDGPAHRLLLDDDDRISEPGTGRTSLAEPEPGRTPQAEPGPGRTAPSAADAPPSGSPPASLN